MTIGRMLELFGVSVPDSPHLSTSTHSGVGKDAGWLDIKSILKCSSTLYSLKSRQLIAIYKITD